MGQVDRRGARSQPSNGRRCRPPHGRARQGKAGFATLQQGGERVQIYVRSMQSANKVSRFTNCSISATTLRVGYLFRTRTGELTSMSSA